MTASTKNKSVMTITADLIIDLYLEAKKLPPKQREVAIEKIKILSKNLSKTAYVDM